MIEHEEIGWLCYVGRRNHLLVIHANKRFRPACNIASIPDFPGSLWADEREDADYCYLCRKVIWTNQFLRNHPSAPRAAPFNGFTKLKRLRR